MMKRDKCREAFEFWASGGSRKLFYNLTRLAGGEYASIYTEHAWRAYEAGWLAR